VHLPIVHRSITRAGENTPPWGVVYVPCACDPRPSSPPMFCPDCGKVIDPKGLKAVRLMGFVGVVHSTSPKIEAF